VIDSDRIVDPQLENLLLDTSDHLVGIGKTFLSDGNSRLYWSRRGLSQFSAGNLCLSPSSQSRVLQNTSLFLLGMFFFFKLATQTMAATPAVLVDSDLNPHPVMIHSVTEGLISYFDNDRQLRVESIDHFVQIRQIGQELRTVSPTHPHIGSQIPGDPPTGWIQLVDGQRLTGRWIIDDELGEKLVWLHPFLGRIAMDLDQISVVCPSGRIPEQERRSQQLSDDRIVLINGDKLDGFVAGISSTGLEFQPKGHEDILVLPIDRLRTVSMANVAKRYQTNRCTVWLEDGSRLVARSLEIASDQVFLEPLLIDSTSLKTVPLKQIVRIDLALSDGYLVDLVDLPMKIAAGGTVWGLPLGPSIQGSSIQMHAPVTVTYDLPKEAIRFSATAALVGGPEPLIAHAWADFEVIVHAGNQNTSRHRINVVRRIAPINTVLDGHGLTIEVVTADNGPIMDRMLLHQGLVLVRQSRESPIR